jgi:ABC-type Fe3+ transport system substrate-binding protein
MDLVNYQTQIEQQYTNLKAQIEQQTVELHRLEGEYRIIDRLLKEQAANQVQTGPVIVPSTPVQLEFPRNDGTTEPYEPDTLEKFPSEALDDRPGTTPSEPASGDNGSPSSDGPTLA